MTSLRCAPVIHAAAGTPPPTPPTSNVLSTWWRRPVHKLRVNRFKPVRPDQVVEVDLAICCFDALRPPAQTAEIIVIGFIKGDWTYVCIPLIPCCLLTEAELGLGICGHSRKILLRQI